MIDLTRTTTALLDGLHDPGDDAVWSEFDRRYRPILVRRAAGRGVAVATSHPRPAPAAKPHTNTSRCALGPIDRPGQRSCTGAPTLV